MMISCPIYFPSPLQVAYQSSRSRSIATRRRVRAFRTPCRGPVRRRDGHAKDAPRSPRTRLAVLGVPSGCGRVSGDPLVTIARPQMTHLRPVVSIPAAGPLTPGTIWGLTSRVARPPRAKIRCDDTARTKDGSLGDKSYRTRQLVRDDRSYPPREGVGGDRPKGVLGASPARRMQLAPSTPTRREDSAKRIAGPRTCIGVCSWK